MAKFRTVSYIIDAVKWTGANTSICSTFMKDSGAYISYDKYKLGGIIIPTPEGTLEAAPGDWIIRNIKGEFFPCSQDIFNKIYKEV